jgi:hypothetical protein
MTAQSQGETHRSLTPYTDLLLGPNFVSGHLDINIRTSLILNTLDSYQTNDLRWWSCLDELYEQTSSTEAYRFLTSRIAISHAADPIGALVPERDMILLTKAELLSKILSEPNHVLPDFEQWYIFSKILEATENNLQLNAKLFETIATSSNKIASEENVELQVKQERFCPSLVQYCQKRLLEAAINNPKVVLFDANFSAKTRLLAALQDIDPTEVELKGIRDNKSEDPALQTMILTRLYEGNPNRCMQDRDELSDIVKDDSRPLSIRLAAGRYLLSAYLELREQEDSRASTEDFRTNYIDLLRDNQLITFEGGSFRLATPQQYDGSLTNCLEWNQFLLLKEKVTGSLKQDTESLKLEDDPPQSIAVGLSALAAKGAYDRSVLDNTASRSATVPGVNYQDAALSAYCLKDPKSDSHPDTGQFLGLDLIANGFLNYLRVLERKDLTAIEICKEISRSSQLAIETRQRAYELAQKLYEENREQRDGFPYVILMDKPEHTADAFNYPKFPQRMRNFGAALASMPLEVGTTLLRHYAASEDKMNQLVGEIALNSQFSGSKQNSHADSIEFNNNVIGLLLHICNNSSVVRSPAFKALLERTTKTVIADSTNLDLPAGVLKYLCQEINSDDLGEMAAQALAEHLQVRLDAHQARGVLIQNPPQELIDFLFTLSRSQALLGTVAPSDVLAIISDDNSWISQTLATYVTSVSDFAEHRREPDLDTLLKRSHDPQALIELAEIIKRYHRSKADTVENRLFTSVCSRLELPAWLKDGDQNTDWVRADKQEGSINFEVLMEALKKIALSASVESKVDSSVDANATTDNSAAAKAFNALAAMKHEAALKQLTELSMTLLSHNRGRDVERSLLLVKAMLMQQDDAQIKGLLHGFLHNEQISNDIRTAIDEGLRVEFRTDSLMPTDESVDASGRGRPAAIALGKDLYNPVGNGKVSANAVRVVSELTAAWSTEVLLQLLSNDTTFDRPEICKLVLDGLARMHRTLSEEQLKKISDFVDRAIIRNQHELAEQAVYLLATDLYFIDVKYMASLLENNGSSHNARMQSIDWLLFPTHRTDFSVAQVAKYYSELSPVLFNAAAQSVDVTDNSQISLLAQRKHIEENLAFDHQSLATTLDNINLLLTTCLKELIVLRSGDLSETASRRIEELEQFCSRLAKSFELPGQAGNATNFKYGRMDSKEQIFVKARQVMRSLLNLFKLSNSTDIKEAALNSIAPHIELVRPTDMAFSDQALSVALLDYAKYRTDADLTAATALHFAWKIAQQTGITSDLIRDTNTLTMDSNTKLGQRAIWLLAQNQRAESVDTSFF